MGRKPCGKGRGWEIHFRRHRGEQGLQQAQEAKELNSVAPRCCQPVPQGLQVTRYLVRSQSQKGSPSGSEGLCPSKGAGLPKSHRATQPFGSVLWGRGEGGEVGQHERRKLCGGFFPRQRQNTEDPAACTFVPAHHPLASARSLLSPPALVPSHFPAP